MSKYNFGSIWNRLERILLNRMGDSVEEMERKIQDLVAEGQLTDEQYAQLLTVINSLLKSGEVKKDDLTSVLQVEIDKIKNKINKGEITSNDLDLNNFKVTQQMLEDDVKQMMTGNTPINTVPADNSLTTVKYIDRSVSLPKINDPSDLLPKSLELSVLENNGRVRTGYVYLNAGDKIWIKDYNISIAVYHEYDEEGTIETSYKSGWIKEFEAIESRNYIIRVKFDDDSNLTDLVEYISSVIYVEHHKMALNRDSFNAELTKRQYGTLDFIPGIITVIDGSGKIYGGSSNRVGVEHLKMKAGETIYLNDSNNFKMSFWEEGTERFVNGWRTVEYKADRDLTVSFAIGKVNDAPITPFEGKSVVDYKNLNSFIEMSDLNKVSVGAVTKFVMLNGNDSNSGNNASDGYESLQKAVSEGAETVYMERGKYRQSFNAAPEKLKILPLDNVSDTDSLIEPLPKIEFIGAENLTDWEPFEGIYRKSVASNFPNYQAYFVDQTIEKMSDGSRPQYRCLLWESDPTDLKYKFDYLLNPLLSIDEVKQTTGSFYYDGTYIYIHPTNINNVFHAPDFGDGLNFSGIKQLYIEDLVADYFGNTPMNLDKVGTVYARNCDALHSGYSDGFSLDYTNGEFHNCTGAKNRNDGFNLHHYGYTEFYNCRGLYNYDDGISHHEYCIGTVHSGLWEGNGKGGISPVNHSKVNTFNNVSKGNKYGLYHIGYDENITAISQGNLYLNNEVGIVNSGYTLISNDKFVGNGTKFSGETPVEEY